MKAEKYNETIRIILLARHADTLCSRAVEFFLHQRKHFSLCTNPYELALKLESDPGSIVTILITRPSMVSKQVADFIGSHPFNLCLVGWLDPHENPADRAFSISPDLLTMTIRRFEQLANVLKMLDRIVRDKTNSRDINRIRQPLLSQPVRDLLSDDELNAILGMA